MKLINVKLATLCLLFCNPLFMLASEKNNQNSKKLDWFIPDEDDDADVVEESTLEKAINKRPVLFSEGPCSLPFRVISSEESEILRKEREERILKNKNCSKESQSKERIDSKS